MKFTDAQRAQRLDKQVKQLRFTQQTALDTIATLTDLMSRATPAAPDTGAWSGAIAAANAFHDANAVKSQS